MIRSGHYLPRFIDWMEHVALAPPGLKSAYREIVGHLKRANRNGVRFALDDTVTDALPYSCLLSDYDLRPPYPVTVIEYHEEMREYVIVAEDLGTHVKLRTYASPQGTVVAICPFEVRIEYVDHWVPIEIRCWSTELADKLAEVQGHTPKEAFDTAAELLDRAASILARLCAVLANNHVELTDVEPDAKENRVRRIKGRVPLYTYKTLVIGAPKKRQGRGGTGTHASPRSHLRRGFYRTSPKGVRHWVKATMVMGETPGFVHKDYQVEGGLK